MIMYKCLHGLVLPYLADDCIPVTTVAVYSTFGLPTVDVLLFQEPRLYSAHATLRLLLLLCGTVCHNFSADFCRKTEDIVV